MSRWVVCLALVLAALVMCVDESGEPEVVFCGPPGAPELRSAQEALVAISGTRWAPGEIEVCWEPFDGFERFARERHTVRVAAGLWEEALSEDSVRETLARIGGELPEDFVPVTFVGWAPCSAQSTGIRIRVDDERAHVHAFGRELDGVRGGMSLDFFYEADRPWCRSADDPGRVLRCIHIDALHEFGHALGVVHGFDRLDYDDPDCVQRASHEHGDLYLGEYDPDSVMTHCSDNRSALSPEDKAGIQAWYYGPEHFGYQCRPFEGG